jgi:hypothetical protein
LYDIGVALQEPTFGVKYAVPLGLKSGTSTYGV